MLAYIKIGMLSGIEIKNIVDLPTMNAGNIGDVVKSLFKSTSNYSEITMIEVWGQINEETAVYYLGGGSGTDQQTEITVEDFVEYIVNDEFADLTKSKKSPAKKQKAPKNTSWKNSPEGWLNKIPLVSSDLIFSAFDKFGNVYNNIPVKRLATQIGDLFTELSYEYADDDLDMDYYSEAKKLANALKTKN